PSLAGYLVPRYSFLRRAPSTDLQKFYQTPLWQERRVVILIAAARLATLVQHRCRGNSVVNALSTVKKLSASPHPTCTTAHLRAFPDAFVVQSPRGPYAVSTPTLWHGNGVM